MRRDIGKNKNGGRSAGANTTWKNGDLTSKNGDLTCKNGDLDRNDDDWSSKHGDCSADSNGAGYWAPYGRDAGDVFSPQRELRKSGSGRAFINDDLALLSEKKKCSDLIMSDY